MDLRVQGMRRWIDHMSWHEGSLMISFSPAFLRWLCKQFIMANDYPYERMDFYDVLELMLLEGEWWDVISKIFRPSEFLKGLHFFVCFWCFWDLNYWFFHAYIGPVRLIGASYLHCAWEQPQVAIEPIQVVPIGKDVLGDLNVVEILTEVKCHMEGLTHEIDETTINQISYANSKTHHQSSSPYWLATEQDSSWSGLLWALWLVFLDIWM